jgi:hypothetical protein
MNKHSLKLALVWSVLLGAAALAAPASAQIVTTTFGSYCAAIVDNTGTRVLIADVGTGFVSNCHLLSDMSFNGICDEAFSACVSNKFEIGAGDETGILTAYNLQRSATGGPFNLCRPYFFPSLGAAPVFLTSSGTDSFSGAPLYNLDAQDLDGDGMFDDSVPPGTIVQVVLDNKPTAASGKCLGVRTVFQHRVGTCKLCKIRKYYNTCTSNRTITQIKELERPCQLGTFRAQPGSSGTAVATTILGQYITLASTGNTGARVSAGSIAFGTLLSELTTCATSSLTPQPTFGGRWLEVFLSFLPGGVTLKPVAKPGSEKLVTFCHDIE